MSALLPVSWSSHARLDMAGRSAWGRAGGRGRGSGHGWPGWGERPRVAGAGGSGHGSPGLAERARRLACAAAAVVTL